jgi:hypothetical protein
MAFPPMDIQSIANQEPAVKIDNLFRRTEPPMTG